MSEVLIKTVTRNVPCRLTEDELRQRGDSLAEVVESRHAEEKRQADLKSQMKARITELEAKQTQLAIAISRKEEYRDVSCDIFGDPTHDTATVVRRDTGEAIEKRPLTDAERQKALPLEPVTA
jgi:hypothetical protein